MIIFTLVVILNNKLSSCIKLKFPRTARLGKVRRPSSAFDLHSLIIGGTIRVEKILPLLRSDVNVNFFLGASLLGSLDGWTWVLAPG